MFKVGDIVKARYSKYILRGTILEISEDEAIIEIPCYYGSVKSFTTCCKIKELMEAK